ncbi:MAG: type III ribulose-bisphosphate carboxylase [Candidatus ainarchaeum sp.]|nr:type III ribulose-bisphosphate carboxylase [Candidatus ainarchaeum sp.]
MDRVIESKGYIDLNYVPSKEELVCAFFVEPAKGISFETAVKKVASESSIGTWTDIDNLSHKLFEELSPKVFCIDKKKGIFRIAYSKQLFEEHNIAQIVSSVAGNIFGMKDLKSIRLLDIDFPESFVRHYSGPMYGVEGIRKILSVKDRPFVGAVVKPKIGLTEEQHSNIAFDSWVGGCDYVSDDENLTSMPYNNFEKRVKLTLKARDRAEKITGEKKAYLPNITAPYYEMVRRAEFVLAHGGEFVMVDFVTAGWSAIQALKDQDFRVILHGHRAMHAAFTRDPKHGISMLVLSKLCRLIGFDQLQVGGFAGRMSEDKDDVSRIGEVIEQKVVSEDIFKHRLQENWLKLKPTMAVCSGGLSPANVQPLIHALGRDILISFGGGVHGHPAGTIAGAKAARQAVDAEMLGIDPLEYAKTHLELSLALKKWKIKK